MVRKRNEEYGNDTLASTAMAALEVARLLGSAEAPLGEIVLPPLLLESTTIKRTDRVYAVALDLRAQNIVVAGRDKRVALYQVQEEMNTEMGIGDEFSQSCGEGGASPAKGSDATSVDRSPSQPRLHDSHVTELRTEKTVTPVWDVAADDFVYAVA
eukprot:4305356-Pleurochrysis_carterae.AAC.1